MLQHRAELPRDTIPTFENTLCRWYSTVRELMNSWVPISGFDGRRRRAAAIWSSRGEQARRRSPETQDQLTDAQLQIARLAHDGLSNPDGTQLFISSRTVEYHLHKVFSKVGIVSRGQLGPVLQHQRTPLPA